MRFSTTFLVVYLIFGVSAQVFAQDSLPNDKRYWQYHSWYKSHSVLHLIVSGKDRPHLDQALKTLDRLKKRKVLIGNVVVIAEPEINLSSSLESSKAKEAGTAKLIKNLGISQSSMEAASALVKKFGIKHSPTWVVRFRGKDYVFEGLRSPEKLFTSQGIFRAGSYVKGESRRAF